LVSEEEVKMNKTIMLMFFTIFLVVVSFVPVLAEWVPLPADLKIVKPEPGVPGAGFSGIFDGTYSGGGYGKRVTVAVKEVYKEGVSVVYATQNKYEYVTGKFRDFNFKRLDLLLNSGARVVLTLDTSNGTIHAEYTDSGGKNEATLFFRK
jgi:hypothetical protein